MSGKVKEVAVEEAERIKTLTSDAVRSGAYLYPLRVSLSRCFLFFSLPQSLEGIGIGIGIGVEQKRIAFIPICPEHG